MKDAYYRLKFILTGDCGHACSMDSRYGYVPEADCPVHDARPIFKTIASLDLLHSTKEDVEKYKEAIRTSHN